MWCNGHDRIVMNGYIWIETSTRDVKEDLESGDGGVDVVYRFTHIVHRDAKIDCLIYHCATAM